MKVKCVALIDIGPLVHGEVFSAKLDSCGNLSFTKKGIRYFSSCDGWKKIIEVVEDGKKIKRASGQV